MKFENRFFTSFCLLFLVFAMAAQTTQMSEADRDRWLKEMRTYKHDFLTKELDLSREQQRDFFPLYDEMEDAVQKLNDETRQEETRIAANTEASDIEIENAARTVFEQKRAEGQIEMTYFDKFRSILSPRQLLALKNSEKKFTQQLIKHHRRSRSTK